MNRTNFQWMWSLSLCPLFCLLSSCGQDPSFTEQGYSPSRGKEGSVLGSADAEGEESEGNNQNQTAADQGVAGDGEGQGIDDVGQEEMAENDTESYRGDCPVVDVESLDCLPTGSSGIEVGARFKPYSQTAVQAGPGSVDILWVVDNSGSMAEEQTYLGLNFATFIDRLTASGANFQTAVTSTDVCADQLSPDLSQRVCVSGHGDSVHHRGGFVGSAGRQIIRSGDADAELRFSDYTALGTNGSSYEHGLWAARLAIDKVQSGANDPLLRNDAFLAIIVVSDEEDDGIGLGMTDGFTGDNYVDLGLTTFHWDHQQMIEYLANAKGMGKFSISAITGTRDANGSLCRAPHSQPVEEGGQYLAAAAATGGISQSICETDWDASLAEIGQDLNAQIQQIVLKETPDPATIRVFVDGVKTDVWSYIAGTNAIKFDSDSIPVVGAQIEIRYLALIP